jgi:hypothetical protein
MKKINFVCPVPIDQQPIYEYEQLKASTFFYWTTDNNKPYYTRLLILLLTNYIVTILLGHFQFHMGVSGLKTLALESLIGFSFIILFFLRLYLGWRYVYRRLKQATITYEESGWYDGQTWVKSPDVLIKDILVADYKLLPVIKRLEMTLGFLLLYFGWVYLALNS